MAPEELVALAEWQREHGLGDPEGEPRLSRESVTHARGMEVTNA